MKSFWRSYYNLECIFNIQQNNLISTTVQRLKSHNITQHNRIYQTLECWKTSDIAYSAD